jgi:hypothetical protein
MADDKTSHSTASHVRSTPASRSVIRFSGRAVSLSEAEGYEQRPGMLHAATRYGGFDPATSQ